MAKLATKYAKHRNLDQDRNLLEDKKIDKPNFALSIEHIYRPRQLPGIKYQKNNI